MRPIFIDFETHRPRLTNRRSGKLASNSSEIVDLAAFCIQNNLNTGIAGLIDTSRAIKLLKTNELRSYKKQTKISSGSTDHFSAEGIRNRAEAARTIIFTAYLQRPDQLPTRREFRVFDLAVWTQAEIQKSHSELATLLKRNGFGDLIGLQRAVIWWRKRF